MESEEDKKRLKALLKGMKNLMSGKFPVQIPRSGKDDQLEAVITQFNMMAQKLDKYFSNNAFHKPEHSSLFVTLQILDLDKEFRIVGASKAVKSILKWDLKDIENQPVTQILRESSLPNWERMVADITQLKMERTSQKLWFKTAQDLTFRGYFFIAEKEETTSSNIKYSLHAFATEVLEKVYDKFFPLGGDRSPFKIESEFADILLSPSELKTMKKVHNYVLSNLKNKLPSLSDMAAKFHINQNKLIANFKLTYGYTPHSLHAQIRLDRSLELLINTERSISEIAKTYFSNNSHFSHTIKRRYGISPTEIRNNITTKKVTKKKA